MLAKIAHLEHLKQLVCEFANKRPSVAPKTSPAPNNVPVQGFRRASSIQAEKPVAKNGHGLEESARASYAYTVFRELAEATRGSSSAVATTAQLTLVTMADTSRRALRESKP